MGRRSGQATHRRSPNLLISIRDRGCCGSPYLLQAGVTLAARDPQTASWLTAPFEKFWEELERAAPAIGNHPRAAVSTLSLACAAGAAYYAR